MSGSAHTSPSLAHAVAPPTSTASTPNGGTTSAHGALAHELERAVSLKQQADALLQSPALKQPDAADADARGALVDRASGLLDQVMEAAEQALEPNKQQHSTRLEEHRSRAAFCLGWATARRAQLVQSDQLLPLRLQAALDHLQLAASLAPWFPNEPPQLAHTPSVTRPNDPNRHHASVDGFPLVPAWGAELVAELARVQTILALAKAMSIQARRSSEREDQSRDDNDDEQEEEHQLAELIDLACRRNVQALFTPVDPHSTASATGPSDEATGGNASLADASTVLGNARLLRDVLSALVPYTTSPAAWKLRLEWATHIADVQFVSASLSANRLVDVASAEAANLQRSHISPHERTRIKRVLEKTARRMAPYEMRQGNVLLWLGRVMLDAVGALYLGRTREGFQAERRRREQQARAGTDGSGRAMEQDDDDEEEEEGVPVPENDLVRETRQVLIRGASYSLLLGLLLDGTRKADSVSPSIAAAALFENAYASILRAPASARRRRLELRVLRRVSMMASARESDSLVDTAYGSRQLEATYCDLEHLDNTSSPEVIELRSQRIERALLINERLISLGDGASSGLRSTRNGRGRGGTGLDEDEMDESDREQAAEEEEEEDEGGEDDLDDDDSEDEEARISKALGRTRLS
ncbi:hypothetical protein C6P46_002172 [Rhodotorula mucilaginosa]|jgi:regulator of extracellular matrix RemA (YlzA/DUF370 family)|uniref:Uncharacterized protein n=1 Tax=Rhodotorula mucilaginosa TaxID=5537 RepID=A0A9P7B1B2_RHOMI|nr:hypothetical protein C6P46_002172 [Rhodotorula mucilaginosa]